MPTQAVLDLSPFEDTAAYQREIARMIEQTRGLETALRQEQARVARLRQTIGQLRLQLGQQVIDLP